MVRLQNVSQFLKIYNCLNLKLLVRCSIVLRKRSGRIPQKFFPTFDNVFNCKLIPTGVFLRADQDKARIAAGWAGLAFTAFLAAIVRLQFLTYFCNSLIK